jgi:peroxiredoxin
MKKSTNILICLVLFFGVAFAHKKNLIKGEIDSKMDGKEIFIYHILPSFSSLMPGQTYTDTIRHGKFNFQVDANGYENFGFRIVHNGQQYHCAIKMVPGDVRVIFLDTLLKTFKVNDDGLNVEVSKAFGRLSAAKGDTSLLIKTVNEYAARPFYTCLLFSLVDKVPESQIIKMYSEVPETNRRNSWSIDLQLLIAKFLIGKTAPDFVQQSPDGKSIRLSDFRGKYVLLDFWASWCIPCRRDNPNLVKAYASFNKKGFEIIGISLDQEKNDWKSAIRQDGLNWVHVSDLKGWNNNVSRNLYKIKSVPANYLIDPKGIIIAKNLRGEQLMIKLKELFD